MLVFGTCSGTIKEQIPQGGCWHVARRGEMLLVYEIPPQVAMLDIPPAQKKH